MFGKLFEWFIGLSFDLLSKWKVTRAILNKLIGFREPEKPFEETIREWVREIQEKEKTKTD